MNRRSSQTALRHLLLTAFSVGSVGACAALPGRGEWTAETPAVEGCVLEVANRNFKDVDVFLAFGATHVRLGRILSQDTERFPIPPGLLGARARVLVQQAGSAWQYTTDEAYFGSGHRLQLVVTSDLAQSLLVSW